MRRRDTRLVVDVCKNLEAKFWIFVQHFQAALYVVAAMFLDEILVGEQTFEIDADPFAPGRAGISRKGRTTIGDELVEVIGHNVLPAWAIVLILATVRRHLKVSSVTLF